MNIQHIEELLRSLKAQIGNLESSLQAGADPDTLNRLSKSVVLSAAVVDEMISGIAAKRTMPGQKACGYSPTPRVSAQFGFPR